MGIEKRGNSTIAAIAQLSIFRAGRVTIPILGWFMVVYIIFTHINGASNMEKPTMHRNELHRICAVGGSFSLCYPTKSNEVFGIMK